MLHILGLIHGIVNIGVLLVTPYIFEAQIRTYIVTTLGQSI